MDVDMGNKRVLIDNLSFDRKKGMTYLCPYNPEFLNVRGHYGALNFDYIKFGVKGCDLGDECFSDEVISKKTFNFLSTRSHPSLLDDDV